MTGRYAPSTTAETRELQLGRSLLSVLAQSSVGGHSEGYAYGLNLLVFAVHPNSKSQLSQEVYSFLATFLPLQTLLPFNSHFLSTYCVQINLVSLSWKTAILAASPNYKRSPEKILTPRQMPGQLDQNCWKGTQASVFLRLPEDSHMQSIYGFKY